MFCSLSLFWTILSQLSFAISPKKGVGICSSGFMCGDTWKFNGVSWWYDWRWDQGERQWHHCTNSPRPGYVPMILDEAHANTAIIPSDAKYVLGFNEPNEGGSASMTPEHAGKIWPLVERKAGNRTLISPALAGCDIFPDMCIQWYERFFNACPNCRVDAIAIHGYHCVPYRMMNAIAQISKQFNRKIWLTEFSCKGNVSVDDDLNFMKVILPMLERSPYVERYAWFCNRLRNTTSFLPNLSTELEDHNSSNLNRLGQFYNNFHI